MAKWILGVFVVFFVQLSWAAPEGYYAFIKDSPNKDSLFQVLSAYHLPRPEGDSILPKCSQMQCFTHSPVSYHKARELIFGFLYLEGSSPQTYEIDTYYCNKTLTNKDFTKHNQLAPMQIPDNNVVNVEHAWPQSHFNNQFPKAFQKADLHILFPTLSYINSIRGNYPFGEVVKPQQAPCSQAALGINAEGERVFEPDDIIKGDMARAIFYFSTRYKAKVDKTQEETLRRWHQMDPPDQHEIEINDKIFTIQKNRNPFVDHPEFVGHISDF
jgi:endonuclease I